jgi:peptidoglycan/LPS O-acetylase OafA/YrhL
VLLLLHVAGSPRAASLASSEILFGARMGHPATLAQALGFATFDVLFRYGLQPTFDWALWTMPLEFKGSLLVYGLIGAFAYLPRLGRPGRVAVAGMVCAGLFIAALPLGACFCLGYLMAEAVVTADAAPAWLGRAPRLVPVLTLLLAVTCDVTGRSYDAITAAWALAVVQAAAFWPPVRAFLSNGISRWLGRVSFPLYLVHVPVIGCCGFLFVGLVKGGMSAAAATHVTVAVATIAALVAARALLPMEDLAIAWSRAVNSSRPRIPVSLKPGAAD